MGSRLHGNDERRRAHPQSSARIHAPTTVIPATAGIHGEGGDGFPSARERRRRESTRGRRWVPVCTGTTGGGGGATIVGENPRPHNRHSRDGGNPRGGRRWVPVCTGTTGGGGRMAPQSSFPRRRESTGGPAMGSRLHGNDGRRRAHPQSDGGIHGGAATIVIPATAGIHGGGAAMGSRLHGNDGGDRAPTNDGRRRRTHNRRRESTAPQSSFPRRRESTGGRRIHGDGPPHNRHSRDGGNPRGGGRRWVPVCTGTTGGGGRTHNRHSREWSNARVSLSGNDGARPCGSWSCTRAGRRPSPSRSRRRCCASGLWRSRPPARRPA